jgi:hypothetical protein
MSEENWWPTKEEYDLKITKEKYSDFIEHMRFIESKLRSPLCPTT